MAASSGRARLFFALWPSVEVAAEIARRSDALKIAGRRTTRQRLHLTLAFHGMCDPRQTARLQQLAASVSACPFDIWLDHVGHFKRSAVTWLGCTQVPDALQALAAQLAPQGVDNHVFRPHITLSRDSEVVTPHPTEPIRWQVAAFSLIVSGDCKTPGAYRELDRWTLA